MTIDEDSMNAQPVIETKCEGIGSNDEVNRTLIQTKTMGKLPGSIGMVECKNSQQDASSTTDSSQVENEASEPKLTYDINLKAEYILDEKHPCLAAEPTPKVRTGDDTDGKKKPKENRHKKNVRNSMKRVKEESLSDMKVCKALMLGKPCEFGDKCRYSHDLKELLSLREADIKEIEGGCPIYHKKG